MKFKIGCQIVLPAFLRAVPIVARIAVPIAVLIAVLIADLEAVQKADPAAVQKADQKIDLEVVLNIDQQAYQILL